MKSFRGKMLSGTIVAMLCFSMHGCLTFRAAPETITNHLKNNNVQGGIFHYEAGKLRMQYAQAGDSTKPIVLFVHGSPGSLSAFTGFLTDTSLLHKAFLLSSDRPGFGHSNFGVGERSLKKQGTILRHLIDLKNNGQPVILVGHSLGGPLIAKMAMEYPDLIDGLVIVAGAMDPEQEPNDSWWRAPFASPFMSFLLPRSIRASNEELYHLKPELESMLPYWKEIKCPVVIVHGKKDSLVPFENVHFAEQQLVNAPVNYIIDENADHFIPWQQPHLINEGIMLILDKSEMFRTARQTAYR